MAEIKAVHFDMDGTLLNSKPLIRQSFVHSWEHVVGTTPPVGRFMPLVGIPLKTMMEDVLRSETGAQDPSCITELLFHYRKFMHENEASILTMFDGCNELLRTLHERGTKLGLVTSKLRDIALRHLNIFGVVPLFSALVFEEDTTKHKPDPAPFLLAAQRCGTSPAESLAVGDSPADLFSSRAAGMTFAAAVWGADPKDVLLESKPDHAFLSPLDILTLLDSKGRDLRVL